MGHYYVAGCDWLDIRMKKPRGWRAVPLVVTILLLLSCSLSVFIPLSNASWQEVLGVSARVLSLEGDFPSRLLSDADDCTHSMEYWRNHPESWPVEQLTIGDVVYSKMEILRLLELSPPDFYLIRLAQQLPAAQLNIFKGANPEDIEPVINAVNEWFLQHPLGSPVEDDQSKTLTDLSDSLESYNLGLIGPGMCEDEVNTLVTDTPRPWVLQPPRPSPTLAPTLDSQINPTGEPGEEPVPTEIPLPIENATSTATTPPSEEPPVLPTLTPTFEVLPTNVVAETIDRATPTLAPTIDEIELGCTHSPEYWLTYQGEWPLDGLQLGAVEIDQEGMLEILNSQGEDDLTYTLAIQFVLAKLNISQGADPSGIEDTLQEAQAWFDQHSLGSQLKDPDRKTGMALNETLTAFNLGLAGPEACEEHLATPVPTFTVTPLGMPTPPPVGQPSQTPAVTPSDTATYLPTIAPTETPTLTTTITSSIEDGSSASTSAPTEPATPVSPEPPAETPPP
jgi:hypothetical protein